MIIFNDEPCQILSFAHATICKHGQTVQFNSGLIDLSNIYMIMMAKNN